jgi:hypothetical protein
VFLLLGIERVRVVPGDTAFTPLEFTWYPWSHSLAMSVVWGALAALLYLAARRDRRGAFVVGVLVVSHWVLDAIAHRPDLPLAPGLGARVGLGLWRSVPATVLVEGAMFAIGVSVYLFVTRARDRQGRFGLWGLVAFLVLVYLDNVFGAPPPNPTAIAWVSLAFGVVILAWAKWIDRHRPWRLDSEPRPS